ncbi:ATP binding [Apophysomyces ossiformis]|uniref:ATP binding n=1 Tax=Apophysomyces ossiformis TaxID=679940 RepID=A0A8H7BYD6_9FUNG|nr:ATP binding [Apophysomyces ossiformis]
MDIKLVGERVRLLAAVKNLRQECYAAAAQTSRAKLATDPRGNFDYRLPNQSSVTVAGSCSANSLFHFDNHGKHEGFNVTSPHPEKPSKSTETKSILNRSNSFSRFLGRSDSKRSQRTAATGGSAPQDAPPMPPSPKNMQKRNSLEGGIMSMEKVKQTCVKVFGEDGQTRIVNVHNASEAKAVMSKVLHKFGIDESDADQYCIFVNSSTNGEVLQARALSDAELTEICRSPDRPEKERLILRKRHLYPTHEEFKRKGTIHARKQMQRMFEESHPDSDLVSNYSGQGWMPDKQMTLDIITGPSSASSYTSTLVSANSNRPEPLGENGSVRSVRSQSYRIRRFFGERPPSEIISSNLHSFFPNHKREVLETAGIKAQRLSMTRRNSSLGKQDPQHSFRNSVLPELVSVLGVDFEKFFEEEEDDDNISETKKKDSGSELFASSSVSLDNKELEKETTASKSESDDTTSAQSEIQSHDATIQKRSSSLLHLNGVKNINDIRNQEEPQSSNEASIQEEEGEEEREEEEEEEVPSESTKNDVWITVQPPTETGGSLGTQSVDKEAHSSYGLPTEDSAVSWIKGSLIGRGTFGDVYLGLNPISGELMAVKQVELPVVNSATEERKKKMVEALRGEIALLKELHHENIVQYLGSQTDNAHFSIFLEYVPGGSVAGLLASYGAFQEALVKSFVRQILKGLNYLHGKDIVHRDIKGANVLVDNKGGVKITDFGISKKVEEDMMRLAAPHRPSLQGSIFWMAPEVVKQTHYTLKADIWSLGCMVVEMVTGDHPFPEYSQMQAIFQIGSYIAPNVPAHISEEAQDFLRCTFKLDHEERPTAGELLEHAFLCTNEKEASTER